MNQYTNVQVNLHLLKHVKFQHNNIIKYNSLYSACAEISRSLNDLNYYFNSQCKLSDHFCPLEN